MHCPIREHCPAYPQCTDCLVERAVQRRTVGRPISGSGTDGRPISGQDSDHLNIILLGQFSVTLLCGWALAHLNFGSESDVVSDPGPHEPALLWIWKRSENITDPKTLLCRYTLITVHIFTSATVRRKSRIGNILDFFLNSA